MDIATLELALTLAAAGLVIAAGAVSIAVLPWTRDELTSSAAAVVAVPQVAMFAGRSLALQQGRGATSAGSPPSALPRRARC